jgi:hypothetical protein
MRTDDTARGLFHGTECTRGCQVRAVPSPYNRDRPPNQPCPWCHARPGVACVTVGRLRRPLAAFGRSHPSRAAAAA